MAPEVAVVMPYFQREPGILRETLRYVFAQRNAPSFKLIIVDDGSPIPAEGELAELAETQRSQITLICRPNGGVAAACNTGLDVIPATVCWVARLDSDDHWAPDHLAEAAAMMRAGFDFFFANELGGEGVPRLEYLGFRPEEHFPRPEGPGLFEMRHGGFQRMMVQHAQVCTSTIMFRHSKFASLRYRTTYAMCDDMHLFLDIAQQSPRVAFSSRVRVNHGPGLHVNQIHDWKTNRALLTACDFANYHARVLREVPLSPAETEVVKRRLSDARSDVAMILLAMLAAGRWPDHRVLTQFLPRHPRLLRDVCFAAARRLAPGRPE
jgi:succinoglycan biosynthesis protein ExoW